MISSLSCPIGGSCALVCGYLAVGYHRPLANWTPPTLVELFDTGDSLFPRHFLLQYLVGVGKCEVEMPAEVVGAFAFALVIVAKTCLRCYLSPLGGTRTGV